MASVELMNDVGVKFMSGIKIIHIDSSACVRVKGGENEQFRVDSGVKQGCIMSPWLFNVYMDEVMKEVKMKMEEREEREIPGGWERVGIAWLLALVYR